MGLEALFEDRKRRKHIKDSIYEAVESDGVCDVCSESGKVMEALNMRLCVSCSEKLLDVAESFDIELPAVEDLNEGFVKSTIISEAMVYFDMSKVQKAADAKFGGDVKGLCKSYGCSVYNIFNDRIDFTPPTKKSKLNQFIIDFDGEFGTERGAQTLKPDADGTMAPLKVKGKGVISAGGASAPASASTSAKVPPAPAPKASTAPAKASASSSQSVTPVNTSGGKSTGLIKADIAKGIKLEAQPAGTASSGVNAFNVSLDIDNKQTVNIQVNVPAKDSDTEAKAIKALVNDIIECPHKYFETFEGSTKDSYHLSYSDLYDFAFDEESFVKGKKLTLVPVYNGKKYSKERIEIETRALLNKSILNSVLITYLDEKTKKAYPVLAEGNNKVKTSIGDAVFTLASPSKNDEVEVDIDWAGIPLKTKMPVKTVAKVTSSTAEDLAKVLIGEDIMGKVIKDYKKVPTADTASITFDGKTFYYYVLFDGVANDTPLKLDFNLSFTDKESPEDANDGVNVTVTYTNTNVSFYRLIMDKVEELYKANYKKSNMADELSMSACDKYESPAKRVVLFDRIGELLKGYFKKTKAVKISGDLDLTEDYYDIDFTMTLGTDTKVTSASFVIKVSDDVPGIFDDAFFAKEVPWVDCKKVDAYTFKCEVTDIDKFSKAIKLSVLEGVILEAFGLTVLNERKIFIV